MMNRRDFVKFLALTGAGVGALPAQVEAFERYYEANTPMVDEPLVAVDEIYLSGLASRSMRISAKFFHDSEHPRHYGFNAFGGMFLWHAQADQKVVLRKEHVTWALEALDPAPEEWMSVGVGHISYVDQTSVRRNLQLLDWRGSLVSGVSLLLRPEP
jgi:hypothetical protein